MSHLLLPPELVRNGLRSVDYRVLHQKLCLDVDLEEQTISVRTTHTSHRAHRTSRRMGDSC